MDIDRGRCRCCPQALCLSRIFLVFAVLGHFPRDYLGLLRLSDDKVDVDYSETPVRSAFGPRASGESVTRLVGSGERAAPPSCRELSLACANHVVHALRLDSVHCCAVAQMNTPSMPVTSRRRLRDH